METRVGVGGWTLSMETRVGVGGWQVCYLYEQFPVLLYVFVCRLLLLLHLRLHRHVDVHTQLLAAKGKHTNVMLT